MSWVASSCRPTAMSEGKKISTVVLSVRRLEYRSTYSFQHIDFSQSTYQGLEELCPSELGLAHTVSPNSFNQIF